jgi:repressor LexA
MKGLTKPQQKLLTFIERFVDAHGFSPTLREMSAGLGHKHVSSVRCHLLALAKKGKVTGLGAGVRTIRAAAKRGQEGLPLLGKVRAGKSLVMAEPPEQVSFEKMFPSRDYFVARVSGSSMIEDHIQDGDFAIVRRQATARDGERVVALVGGEITLKTFYRQGGSILLRPANKDLLPITALESEVHIQGVVVGVFRRLVAPVPPGRLDSKEGS